MLLAMYTGMDRAAGLDASADVYEPQWTQVAQFLTTLDRPTADSMSTWLSPAGRRLEHMPDLFIRQTIHDWGDRRA